MTEQGAIIAAVWIGALLLWLAFLLYYDGLRRPLRPDEIDAFLSTLGPRMVETGNDAARLRAFLDVLMSIPARDPGNVNAPAVKIIRVTIEES